MTIAELARTVADAVGFTREIGFDTSRPDGNPRKLLGRELARALGWRARIGLEEGLASTNQWLERELTEGPQTSRLPGTGGSGRWSPIIEHHASSWRR
jgi:hypothetical protein